MIALLLYVAIATVAVLTLAPQELAGSGAPLAMIYQEATGSAPTAITVIGLFAAVNGALVQMIMASRIVYGMSRKNWLPEPLGRIHPLTRTPVIATTLVTVAVLALGLTLPLLTLAWATSFIILVVFTLMNWALWRLKRLGPAPPGAPDLPRSIPLAGGLLSLAFVLANVALMLGGRFAAH